MGLRNSESNCICLTGYSKGHKCTINPDVYVILDSDIINYEFHLSEIDQCMLHAESEESK